MNSGEKVTVDQLANAIQDRLELYAEWTAEELEPIANDIANKASDKLKQTSPKSTGKKRSGRYAKGWRVKKQYSKRAQAWSYVVYNKTDYQLTHLLEKGHAMRQGGRAKAIPHIRPVEQEAIRDYEDRLKRRLETR